MKKGLMNNSAAKNIILPPGSDAVADCGKYR